MEAVPTGNANIVNTVAQPIGLFWVIYNDKRISAPPVHFPKFISGFLLRNVEGSPTEKITEVFPVVVIPVFEEGSEVRFIAIRSYCVIMAPPVILHRLESFSG